MALRDRGLCQNEILLLKEAYNELSGDWRTAPISGLRLKHK